MTSSRNKGSEGKKPAGEPAASVSQRRRRLIKGAAAAAPGIFTLYSGSAQANLSTHRCTVDDQLEFSTSINNLEFAGEAHEVGGYVRLASGPGIHVIKKKGPEKPKPEAWLVGVPDNTTGTLHYFEAGYNNGGSIEVGSSWQDIITDGNLEWIHTKGTGLNEEDALWFRKPGTTDEYKQEFDEDKTIQVFACIDDSGNVVSAYPLDCEANGLAPPSDSCWASIGTSSMTTWW